MLLLAARVYALDSDWTRSEAALRRVIEQDPDNLVAYGTLGQLYIRQGKLERARQEFENLAARNSGSVAAPTMVGVLLHQQNRIPETVGWYERALKADPRAAVAANNLAWLYAEGHGDIEAAVKLARVAAERLPENAEISDTLGWVYYRKGLAALAIAPFKRAVELSPRTAIYHFHLGLAYVQEGQKDRARESLRRALTLQADFAGSDEARRLVDSL
jgi:tetratricopeptide (TPR) repeat protein